MAILKHISVKNRFYSDAVEYLTCQFDEYTNKPILDEKGRIMERENYLIDGVNCDVDTFGAECIQTNRFYGKNNSVEDVKAHHYIISFSPGDPITMEQALEFGKNWLKEFAPGHQAVVAVHPDGHNNSQNMHIHMVINSVRKFPGRKSIWHDKPCEWKQGCKHKSTGKMMYHAKKWVMDKCMRLGYEQVDLLAKKHTDNYWVEKRLMENNASDGVGITSNKELIRNTIDKILPTVKSFEQLVEVLQWLYKWKIRVTDKTVTFTLPDMKKGIRGNKLGEGYGKDELVKRIEECVSERKARELAFQKAQTERERAARQAEKKKKEQLEKQLREQEALSQKRRRVFNRNEIQIRLYQEEADRPDYNTEYLDYLEGEYIADRDNVSETVLSTSIMTRAEFESKQAVELYREKAEHATALWDDVLDNLSITNHPMKWEYMDYLESIRYKDTSEITLEEAKSEILSYEEFVQVKEADKAKKITVQAEIPKIYNAVDIANEPTIEELYTDMEVEDATPMDVDYTKLSVAERATLLPIPTDDFMAEYDAFRERMGYVGEKLASIQYKMEIYDEFKEEYDYRRRYYGMEKDRILDINKNKGTR
ncbi:MAG: relaxase/mobilization nuclease domain-containing protein [Agathobacter sp.]|nr:relaxase/mobilization nuclease domain-containing protein [Agathobacter sp.]